MDCRINSWIPGIGYTYIDLLRRTWQGFLGCLELEMQLCALITKWPSKRFSVFLLFRTCVVVVFVKCFLLHLSGDKELNCQYFTISYFKKQSHSYRRNSVSPFPLSPPPPQHCCFSMSEKCWILGFCQQLILFWRWGNEVPWGCTAHLLNHALEVTMGQLAINRMIWQQLKNTF